MVEPITSTNDISRKPFEVVRRGYDQQSVRAFLHEVESLVDRLQRSERDLRERAERAETRLHMAENPDEEAMLELLGEETTRVLTSAREAATEIRTKAEASAERLIADATAEAASTRSAAAADADAIRAAAREESDAILEQARTELERRSAEAEEVAARIRQDGADAAAGLREEAQRDVEAAQQEAEAILEAARAEGRAMVAEAQAVRERVLRDLQVRRKKARIQVEKLHAGRDRLLQAYEVVRATIDDATSELNVSLGEARLAADAAARRVEGEPEPTIEQLDAEVSTAGLVDLPIADVDEHHDAAHDDESPGPYSGEVPAVPASPAGGAEPEGAEPEAADTKDAGTAAGDTEAEPPADQAASPAPVEGEPPAESDTAEVPEPSADGAATEMPAVTAITAERRSRRSRRSKAFEGLPAGELARIEPTGEHEGVRLLAEPAVAAPDAGGSEGTEETGATGPTEDAAGEGAEPTAPEEADVTEAATAEIDAPAADETTRAEAASAEGGSAAEEHPAEPAVDGAAEVEPAPEEPAPSEPTTDEAEPSEAAGTTAEEPSEDRPAPAERAEDVFARLRAEASEVASDAEPGEVGDEPTEPTEPTEAADADAASAEGAEPSADAAAFAARADALASIEKELGRRLKRSLADEQNEVLDLLRRAKPKGVDDLLPAVDDHAARWADAGAGPLTDAAASGASWAGGTSGSVLDLADELARSLVGPLRDRIDRSFAASDGNLDDVADRVRALYREWKGQRLAETSHHFTAAAYARGVFDALPAKASVRWTVDPSTPPCPDCDDNVLAGSITKGEAFPTGSPCAPAHTGCRCLVVPA